MEPNQQAVAIVIGCFRVGLGVSELWGGGSFSRTIGLKRRHWLLVRAVGLRELVLGMGLLANSRRPKKWLWARVVGDVLDLAALGRALTKTRNDRARVGIVAGAVLGVTAIDVLVAARS